MSYRIVMIALLSLLVTPAAFGVLIPLERGTATGTTGGKETTVIGYADIEKIFNEHPMKKRLQEEFQADVEKRKKELADLSRAISDLEKVIVSSTTDVNRAKLELDILRAQVKQQQSALLPGTTEAAPAATISSGTAAGNITAIIQGKEAALQDKEAGLEMMKKELDRRKDEMDQRIRQDKLELANLEEKHTAAVLADLYQLLQKVAVDEGVSVIIDKNDVLYGQGSRDLTDKVRERLQGR